MFAVRHGILAPRKRRDRVSLGNGAETSARYAVDGRNVFASTHRRARRRFKNIHTYCVRFRTTDRISRNGHRNVCTVELLRRFTRAVIGEHENTWLKAIVPPARPFFSAGFVVGKKSCETRRRYTLEENSINRLFVVFFADRIASSTPQTILNGKYNTVCRCLDCTRVLRVS